MKSSEDTRFFQVRSPILCISRATLLTHPRFILSIFDACRGNLSRSASILREIIPKKVLKHRYAGFFNFSSILKRGSDRANKIGVTARVHSRFALLAWRAQSCSIVAVDNGLLSATATNWAPIIALIHQPRRARGVTVKLPAGPLAKKGRCYRESSCKCAGTIVRR